jgi:hypothetical protein
VGAERVRRLGELAVPGFAIGATAGAIAGGLSLAAGQPAGWALIAALALALPLGIFGGVYSVLMGVEIFKPGVFAPAGLYWIVAFPLSRLCHELVNSTMIIGSPMLRENILGFLAYQALISLGFAIGFVWIHERLTPRWLMKIKDHNPEAQRLLAKYVRHAEMLWQEKDQRRTARVRSKGVR